MSEEDRRRRAEARRALGMTRFTEEEPAFHEDESVAERLTAMTRLCRAAWLATGRQMPTSGRAHRASYPGEVYLPDWLE